MRGWPRPPHRQRLDQTGRPLNPFTRFTQRRRNQTSGIKLYGAIVAQARLPVFYQELGVPDRLEGRFLVLSLHLFAVLHRLKAEGGDALDLAQELTDRFSADMETVLREIGVGDLSIPKKMRGLAAASASLLGDLEQALPAGEKTVAAVLGQALPADQTLSKAATRRLAHYLMEAVRLLEAQSVAALGAGDLKFPGTIPGAELGDDWHDAGR